MNRGAAMRQTLLSRWRSSACPMRRLVFVRRSTFLSTESFATEAHCLLNISVVAIWSEFLCEVEAARVRRLPKRSSIHLTRTGRSTRSSCRYSVVR